MERELVDLIRTSFAVAALVLNVTLMLVMIGFLIWEILIPAALQVTRLAWRCRYFLAGLGLLAGFTATGAAMIVVLGEQAYLSLMVVLLVDHELRLRRLRAGDTPRAWIRRR